MKRVFLTIAAAMALVATGGMASAADLSNGEGQNCNGLPGSWHFVNNQIPPADRNSLCLLDVTFDTGSCTGVPADQINGNGQNQHWTITGATAQCSGGTDSMLVDASSSCGGRLVLSDFMCEAKKPPPCDPKTQKCD